ncbi:MAG: pilus assembly protein [Bradyrhizobium sp.]|nr:pilus assembly protein [Bradyrhizobium sp.]
MQASAVSAPPKRFFRRFRRNDSGSAAVEFSLVAVPFFALLFAIIETGIVFFAGQVLESAVQDSGRLVYTNQMTGVNTTATQFKSDLCARVAVLMNCTNIDIDIKYYPAGSTITIVDPIDGSGNYDTSGLGFNIPAANSTGTVVIRGFYRWPLIVTGLGYNIANIGRNTANSKRLLTGLTAFHVEPS